MVLHNKYDKETLKKFLDQEGLERTTLSFYRYVILEDLETLRDQLYAEWEALKVLGRIYIAREGINAQLNVPSENLDAFRENLESRVAFKSMPFKVAVEEEDSFLKLKIKIRNKIVADGLDDEEYDVTNVGTHLSAKEFNEAIKNGAIVVDMRNHYESEVGHFEGAILPQVDTFREELPKVKDELEDKKDEKILLYCTGGIRCEKASAYLKHHGFKDVNQLHGGIIDYKHQVDNEGLENKFIGKNFVFDDRLAEKISDDIIAKCHQCGAPCDDHTNCSNVGCNLLFIQCPNCKAKFENCCTPKCKEINALPEETQKEMRKGKLERKRFNKGLQNPDELKDKIKDQLENGFNILY
ncbi:MAG: rhodanese-related sulfurtransferase [Flavobacteriales bacterium]|nr:rhodanese-related sulfurtransferase [Flavobacteriales bacterium]